MNGYPVRSAQMGFRFLLTPGWPGSYNPVRQSVEKRVVRARRPRCRRQLAGVAPTDSTFFNRGSTFRECVE